ncbi:MULTISPECIES: glycosyltransferase family 4 protein [unclassified Microbacterium]|uniref:glycosyltransferase family 4 protein n=1 Tax=unclassified Microbacterium TaxID=2609290 RepID=UPI0016052966|nr:MULTISPECIES: glycosyltransferase family 4 protein [unclassified Microbacterium]QNA91992.1 glycosyltransferase family 4 protein [Microbacterium sp. Se63.02b]QYM65222.1 glycosyltransferase family 4 protein [Microbacterium sp. Se5.02b]
MRIVYLHQYFNTPDQPGSTRSYEFARRLAARGHDVKIVTSERGPGSSAKWSAATIDGFEVHRRQVPYDNTMGAIARLRAFATFAVSAASKARKLHGDVIFATSTPLTIILPAWFAAAGRRTPIVFEVRDSWPTVPIALGYLNNPLAQRAARALERFAYRKSSQVVALSPGMKDDACQHGAEASKITVIPNAADVELFDVDPAVGVEWRAANDISPDAPLIVYTGTFGAANEVEYLVDVAAEAVRLDPTIVFALIGTGAREASVRARAASVNLLGTTVRVLPPVSKNEVSRILAAADIATSVVTENPAMNANSANKFFDTLAAGRAIAINHEGWQADLIREHSVGLVLDRKDVAAAARSILALATNAEALAATQDRARALARSDFARDDLAIKLAEVLESVAPPSAS